MSFLCVLLSWYILPYEGQEPIGIKKKKVNFCQQSYQTAHTVVSASVHLIFFILTVTPSVITSPSYKAQPKANFFQMLLLVPGPLKVSNSGS